MAEAANPFEGYLSQLDNVLYRTPTAGFRARMIVLLVLQAIMIVVGFVYIGLFSLKAIKSRGGEGLWFFRLVQGGQGGRFLVSNIWTVGSVLTIVQAAVGIAYVVDSMRIFLYRGSQANTWALRSFLFIPIFIQGWLNSTSILVSYVSLATAQGNLHWKPVVVNTVLVGTGVALLLLEAGTGIWTALIGQELWTSYLVLHSRLEEASANFTGTPDIAVLFQVQNLFTDFIAVADRFAFAAKCGYAVLPLLPFACLTVNVGGLLLARRIRQDITDRTARLLRYDVDLLSAGSVMSQPAISADRRGSLATAKLKELAIKDPEGDPGWEQASQQALELLELRKAEGDLVTASSTVAAASVVVFGSTIYLATFMGSGDFVDGNWASLEAALFSVSWEMAILLITCYAFLIYNHFRIPPSVNGRRPSTMTVRTAEMDFI